MFKNYLKTALRNLLRNRAYALINIAGLSAGIAAALLIFLVIQYETSFDSFHKKKDVIYRIGTAFYLEGAYSYSEGTAFPVGPAVRNELAQVKNVARIFKTDDEPVTIEDGAAVKRKFKADLYYTEPEFFDLLDFPWLAGDPHSVLSKPGQAALTVEMAEKFFGGWQQALGKRIRKGATGQEIYTITGILENVPARTDFPLEVLISFVSIEHSPYRGNLEDWVSTQGNAYTLVELPEDVSIPKINEDLKAFSLRHKPEEYAKDTYLLQPLSEIHYDAEYGNFRNHTFSKSLITALQLIGFFLVLIACVNFINLATAQAVHRSKEVGVRKVLGSNRNQLVIQFVQETAILTGLAVILALGLAGTALPFLNGLLKTEMAFDLRNAPEIGFFLFVLWLVVTLVSGSYPSVILSGFNPVTALKTKISSGKVGGINLRRGLVVFQFGIAHVLIIGTLIVVSQMNYFRNARLGFDHHSILNITIPNDSVSRSRMDFVRNRFEQNPEIEKVSFSFSSPAARGNWSSDFNFDHSDQSTSFNAILKWADAAFFETYNMGLAAGRMYFPGDTVKEFVVNETLLRKLGISDPNQVLGKELEFWDGVLKGPVVGVVKDFNSLSLRQPMAPVVLSTWKNQYRMLSLRIKPGEESDVIAYAEKVWNEAYPDYIFEYRFMDETLAGFYAQETQLSILYKVFAALAILISCLGLFGLVSYMAVQRTKELGIRKVLGAGKANIIYLLSREFTLLILLAFAVAAPLAYTLMQKWLQQYTYKIEINVWIFLLAMFASICIAWLTVGRVAWNAARANPIRSLRTE